jgi:hypothetical protein
MDSSEFDQLFDSEVIQRLSSFGFRPRGRKGKTIDLLDGITLVSLIRMSGRFRVPGNAAWALCFRHTFLRELNELKVSPDVTGLFPEHYPFKFIPTDLMKSRTEPRYHSRLNFEVDRCNYSSRNSTVVSSELREMADFIADRFVPWARSMTSSVAKAQLQKFGTNMWCEKIWIEDYDAYLKANTAWTGHGEPSKPKCET